jgi:curved DNA-binding protein
MDYYKTLGVDRNASPEEIKKAYRKLAAKNHPDRGGSTEEFQKIEEAYRNLSDPNLKSQHDNPNPFNGGGGFPGGFHFNFGSNPFDDLFAQFTRQQRQRVYTVSLWITLEQVAKGSEETVQFTTPLGLKSFKITVPVGVSDGAQVRYQNLMPDGELQIEFRIHRHYIFERQGLDLRMRVEMSIFDLILGTTITVPTIYGDRLEVTVPPRTKPSASLRVQGKGLQSNGQVGNQFILIDAVIPDTISSELISQIENEVKNNTTNK